MKDQKKYPYGFKGWMNQLWQIFKENGSFKDTSPLDAMKVLDPDAWLVYFNDGLSPRNAYNEDMKNG